VIGSGKLCCGIVAGCSLRRTTNGSYREHCKAAYFVIYRPLWAEHVDLVVAFASGGKRSFAPVNSAKSSTMEADTTIQEGVDVARVKLAASRPLALLSSCRPNDGASAIKSIRQL